MSFAGCQDESLPAGDPAAVTFTDGCVREGWADACGTRVSDNTWTADDAVGIYMLPADVTDLTNNDVFANKKHTVNSSLKMEPDGDANRLYYPLNKKGARFMAYYPYSAGATSTGKLTFDFADQSTRAKKEAMDFCFHRGTKDYTAGTPQLKFSHKFCKILIKLTRGTGAPSARNISARLSGMPKTATVDLNNFSQTKKDSITVGTDSVTVRAYTVSNTDDDATIEAIVAPHSGTGKFAGRKFIFTSADGKTKTYELPNSVTFEAGKVYTFTLDMAGTLIFDGMTNCYIVAPGAELKFPVSRAYRHYKDTGLSTILHVDGSTYTGGFSAAVVWDAAAVINGTPTVSGSGNSATVTVKANSVSGNAVVKIYKTGDGTQTPVWSYHIWVTDYDPTKNTYTNTYNTNNTAYKFVFMDRNLGATEAGLTVAARGLFYQWGRKDPFPATDAVVAGSWSVAATSPTNGTVENTIRNPGVFYTASSSPNDWHYASRNNELWGHSGSKTIYDPCPSGWRVPVNSNMSSTTSPWYGFTTSNVVGTWNSGYSWGANAAYPAAGCRHYSGGDLNIVSTYGYYWAASPSRSSSNASPLVFHSGLLNENNSNSRAYGLTVRCVKEEDPLPTNVVDRLTNCYIVAPSAELKFPVSRAYTHNGTNFTSTLHVDSSTGSTYTTGFSAAVVWDDAGVISGTPTVSGSGNTAIVTVKTDAAVGNAVVKICKSGETTPVWSYHIWVTGYNSTQNTYTNNNNNFVFMDRNLGATEAGLTVAARGLFYQWGRKDPFPVTDAVVAGSWSVAATSPTNGTVENTIRNPGVFYTAGSTSSSDWHYASRNNELWGHSGSKTIYDPCPSGWRVPVNSNMSSTTSPWYGFTKDNGGAWNSGWSWGANAAYPAAGYRPSSGGLSSVGSYGLYWTASPRSFSNNYASDLYFGSGYVNVGYYDDRAEGNTVRCVQE